MREVLVNQLGAMLFLGVVLAIPHSYWLRLFIVVFSVDDLLLAFALVQVFPSSSCLNCFEHVNIGFFMRTVLIRSCFRFTCCRHFLNHSLLLFSKMSRCTNLASLVELFWNIRWLFELDRFLYSHINLKVFLRFICLKQGVSFCINMILRIIFFFYFVDHCLFTLVCRFEHLRHS